MCIRDRTWRRRSRSSAEVRNETGTARIIDVVWSRSKQDTLVLPVSALALLILGDYKATSGWNWHNWMLESKSYGTAVDQQVQDALAEGWAWLTTHGLVMRDTTQTSTGRTQGHAARRRDVAVRPCEVGRRRAPRDGSPPTPRPADRAAVPAWRVRARRLRGHEGGRSPSA